MRKKMKVLVTGGAGFIGSHIAEACLKNGDEVYVIDDLSTGSLENIAHLQRNPIFKNRFHMHEDTIFTQARMVDLVGICDVVYHMAAAVGVQYIIDTPLQGLMTNVRGTDIVLELCDRFRKKVLIASTSEVYGKHAHAPLVETDDCIYGSSDKFRWSYAAGKLIDEFSALAYHRAKGLAVVVTRLFNTVGPRQTGRYGMVLPRFISQAVSNEPITVYGDGKQTRTFTHVSEVVASFVRLMASPKAEGQVVNIGGVEEVSILELALRIKQLTKSDSEILLVPYGQAFPRDFEDMARRVPSTEKLRMLIGQVPSKGLDSILQDILSSETRRTGSRCSDSLEQNFPAR